MKRLSIILLSGLLLFGCSREEVKAPDSMETIQKKQGVPVKVETVEKQDFEKYLTFKGKIKGNQESTVVSMIAGKIESIQKDVNDYVKEDDVILTVPNDVPASQYNQVKESYELAQKTFERMHSLFEKGAISKQDLDQTETQFQVSKSNYESVSKTLNVEAPISGKIGVMYAELGTEVAPGTKLFKIVDDSRLRIRINVPEQQIIHINENQKATAIWNNIELDGKVEKVSSSLDEDSNSFLVDLIFKNPGNNIKTGVTAEVRLKTYTNNSFVVNEQYLLKESDSAYLYLNENSKAVKTKVILGNSFKGQFEILSGISENDLLITEGSKMVENDMLIKVIR